MEPMTIPAIAPPESPAPSSSSSSSDPFVGDGESVGKTKVTEGVMDGSVTSSHLSSMLDW